MADTHAPEPATSVTPKPQPGGFGSLLEQRWPRMVLVLVIVLGIVGVTFTIGQREGWTSIGTGGENAQLLPKVGQQAPELLTADANGNPVFLSALRGHPVWLNFWGSWCEPCQAEMPDIEAAYKTLQPQGVMMLAIAQKEEVQTSIAYANAAGATYPILMDPAEALEGLDPSDPAMPDSLKAMIRQTSTWQVNNYPTHIFIDANGIVRAVVISQLTKDEAVHYGEMLLNYPYSGPPLVTGTPSSTPGASPSASPTDVATP